ncbi:MAG: glycosyl transferase [Proteobacteria bacterium]|nr:glycosyl transferase [Pseudomonadota bacterium]
MSDFHQAGSITTLHDLYGVHEREEYLAMLETKLEEYSRHMRISLLLPSLYAEIENPAVLDRIIAEIRQVRYLHSIVVALGGAPEERQFREAQAYFGRLARDERDVKLVWVDGPRIREVFEEINKREVPTGVQGKGQSVWISLGYIFAREEADVIALHDCDIVTYDRLHLGRLVEPVANPHSDFEFGKGFYSRISPREKAMKGRVTRLFVAPLLDTLTHLMYTHGYSELGLFFNYHLTFKYPLAGEFCFSARLGRGVNIAYDWGLEVSTLSEVYNRLMPKKICQVDLCPNYEHKHQVLSEEDKGRGLHRMVVDIGKFFLFYMRSHGVPLDDAFVNMIRHTYYQKTLAFIRAYSDDSDLNCLAYDRYQEEMTARYFRDFLWTAWEQCREQTEDTQIPSWNRVLFSVPNIYEMLKDAVERDNG